ncbi:ATP-dependent nuclease [Cellvibrio sp. QJXJ]|uniref:ATP-dependent nuclease n=1 Tax=Cellvibrio sp. QJXJ TaxID=2964606 RepID=UPI0021C3871B|nr:ATP-binding protein [Cellvibrio sp. QJXJ]UUA73299.1 AAA family ATPase [Cellvibrio sp. QJXJ]
MGLNGGFLSTKEKIGRAIKVIIKTIRIRKFRSFEDSKEISLSDINVLIGANNSGKSSVLRALHHLQQGLNDPFGDVRVGATKATIDMTFNKQPTTPPWTQFENSRIAYCSITIQSADRRSGQISNQLTVGNGSTTVGEYKSPNSEPSHLIIPFLSKRKTANYLEDVREQFVTQISSDMSNLAAKLSRIANPNFPAYQQYSNACKEILGFVVTSITSPNGQRPGIYLPDQSSVPIDQMGEGVPNIVSLLVSLSMSEGKLFLIEEPENDLHPQALKALLDLIVLSSQKNQFVISTHSNIVVTHLCSVDKSKLFKINSEKGQLPTTATIEEVSNSPRDRVQVLQELGYSFSDYDLWEGWLLLEESSAERIIRDYLIPWFAPKLHRIKTVAANGINNVEPTFNDLSRVVLFTHLQQAYSGLAWVRVDGDDAGKESIEKLRTKFSSIPKDHFSTFDKPQFELYYPAEFQAKANAALAIQGKKQKQEEKGTLLKEVIIWIEQDINRAKIEFEKSAASVITELKLIEKQFLQQKDVRT